VRSRLARTLGLLVALSACAPEPTPSSARAPDFESLLEEVLIPSCATAGCHSATTGAAELFLEGERAYTSITAPTCSNAEAAAKEMQRVVPGEPESSFLFIKMTQPGGMGELMPPAGALSEKDLGRVEDWILGGASGP
jgi:hypothetical protein